MQRTQSNWAIFPPIDGYLPPEDPLVGVWRQLDVVRQCKAALPEVPMVAFAAAVVGLAVVAGTGGGQGQEWFTSTWGFAKQILPLLLAGVLVSGLLLGRPDH